MATRSPSQKIGSRGHRFAMSLIEDHSEWLARDLTEDFGVDAEAELTNTGINGEILKLQFKASQHVRQKGNTVEFKIARKYLEYARSCRYPVIFVRISLADRQAWYLWLQDWLLWQRASGNEPHKDVTIWIDQSQTLTAGLNSSLKDVARWRGETQLALSLIDAMRAATAIFDPELTTQLVSLISKAGPLIGDLALDVVVREAVLLGNGLRGTIDGLAVSQNLFSLVRTFGNRMTARTVGAMVRRDESYSRTGLVGLCILYDKHQGHASSLGLTDYFQKLALPNVAYYCALREAHPGKKGLHFAHGPGSFVFAGLRFDCPADHCFENTYANRGPSAILDYLVRVRAD